MLYSVPDPADEPSTRPAPRLPAMVSILAAGWLLCLLVGTAAVRAVESEAGNPLSFGRSFFLAANALSLTGFDAGFASQRGWLTAGLLAVGILCAWTIAGGAVLRGVVSPQSLLAKSAVILLAVALVASVVRWNVTHALAAIGGAGLHDLSATAPFLWLVLLPLAAAGALGPAAWRGRTTPTLRLNLLGMAAAFAASLLLLGLANGWTVPNAALALDARHGGFSGVTASSVDRWTLVPLLLLGTAGGGAGGGLKVTTALVLILGLWRLYRGGRVGRTFAIAATWLAGLVAMFGVTFVLLVRALPALPVDRVAVLAAAACGNVGLSAAPVSASGADGYILAAAMTLGRVLPWGVIWWSAIAGDEDVAVG